ncbi:hypothetical protein KM043_010920 [Ampulex compressa]|nr:hypothetical protein KM043_010920 [Ampulex compressa]
MHSRLQKVEVPSSGRGLAGSRTPERRLQSAAQSVLGQPSARTVLPGEPHLLGPPRTIVLILAATCVPPAIGPLHRSGYTRGACHPAVAGADLRDGRALKKHERVPLASASFFREQVGAEKSRCCAT